MYLKCNKEEYFKSSEICINAFKDIYNENKNIITIFLFKINFVLFKFKKKYIKYINARISATAVPKINDIGKKNNKVKNFWYLSEKFILFNTIYTFVNNFLDYLRIIQL